MLRDRTWMCKAAFEAGWILFAVIVGFWVTEWRETHRSEQRATRALERIVLQLDANIADIARAYAAQELGVNRTTERRGSYILLNENNILERNFIASFRSLAALFSALASQEDSLLSDSREAHHGARAWFGDQSLVNTGIEEGA